MNIFYTATLAAIAIALAVSIAGAEPVGFAPLPDRIGSAAAGSTEDLLPGEQTMVAFCLRFGDGISATAMPGGGAEFDASGGRHGLVSATGARTILWSWLLGPVRNASAETELDEARIWFIEGGIDAATLGEEFPSSIPNLGMDGRSLEFLNTTDAYRIVGGRTVFVPETMRNTAVPLPSAGVLAAAGLLVLGARRRA